MSVLIIKNSPEEGPGTIGDYLKASAVHYKVVEPWEVKDIDSMVGFDTVVIMGGPMAVYEMQEHPHVKAAARVAEMALQEGRRLLGVCLGAQIIAHVLGARVYKGEAGTEVGWLEVQLTPEALEDPAMRPYSEGSDRVMAFHWHGDTFDLPDGAIRLAGSDKYPNQAFRHGRDVYGMQFHVEVTRAMLALWFRGEAMESEVLDAAERHSEEYARRAAGFCRGFFG